MNVWNDSIYKLLTAANLGLALGAHKSRSTDFTWSMPRVDGFLPSSKKYLVVLGNLTRVFAVKVVKRSRLLTSDK